MDSTVKDFEKFIKYIEDEKPILSTKKNLIGKKDCFKLNSTLENKREVEAPNYTQEQYPVIDLMFEIALSAKIYIRSKNEKGKLSLIKTINLEKFESLNEYEKYVFLLQTYWTKYNFERKLYRVRGIKCFYDTLYGIANKEDLYNRYLYYSVDVSFYHLEFFGFGNLKSVKDVDGKYKNEFYPNEFGVKISYFLVKKAFPYINVDDSYIDILSRIIDKKEPFNKKQDPFSVFKDVFSKGIVKNTIDVDIQSDSEGVYTFKVSLHFKKSIWRKIRLSYKHTLADLHEAIQDAFDFDDDHLYMFYIGGYTKNGEEIYGPNCDEISSGPFTYEVTIEDLELYEGAKMLYLFDFGDGWEFDVDLINIDKTSPIPLKSQIIDSKGASPEQYGGEW